jgi:heterotetrameric sarcosine oxidase gamma subunit
VSLAFLTADATRVRARSPMERPALAAGARLACVEGWNVPNAYSDPGSERAWLTQTVGFIDRCSLAKLEIQAQPRALARIVERASASLAASEQATEQGSARGLALAPGLAACAYGTWWCPATPGRALVLSEPSAAVAVLTAVREAGADAQGTVTVLDVTCGLAALSLIGPQARELLARFCAIDVRPALAPPCAFRPGSVARTPGYVLVEAPDRLLVLVGWALGEYLWRVVADAAADLGGGPVGAQALTQYLERDDA